MIPPILVLAAALGATGAALLASHLLRRARSACVAKLAAGWGMSFTADDRFRITPAVAANFPTPGVADVVLRDLVFAQDKAAGAYRYLFTVEYTTGVLRTKRRHVAVGSYVERATGTEVKATPVVLAPAELTVAEQYEYVRRGEGGGAPRAQSQDVSS